MGLKQSKAKITSSLWSTKTYDIKSRHLERLKRKLSPLCHDTISKRMLALLKAVFTAILKARIGIRKTRARPKI